MFNGVLGIPNPGVTGNYDSDDYARDMADFVGIDNGALIFTIGLGDQVNTPVGDPASADSSSMLQKALEMACTIMRHHLTN